MLAAPCEQITETAWAGVVAGSKLVGKSPTWLMRLAVIGAVRTRLNPGVPPLYAVEDIRRVAADERRSQTEGVAT